MGLASLELLEEQHLETQQALVKIAEVLSVEEDYSQIVQALTEQSAKIEGFADAIRAIKIPAPVVQVEKNEVTLSQDKVVASLESLSQDIKITLQEISKVKPVEKPLSEWSFQVIRNEEGLILSINAKQIK